MHFHYVHGHGHILCLFLCIMFLTYYILLLKHKQDKRINTPLLKNKLSASTTHGCEVNLQSLLFCYVLQDLHISFERKEIKVYPSNHQIEFRNRTFQIILPIHVVRNCLIKHQPTLLEFVNEHISLKWCNKEMIINNDGRKKLSEELKVFSVLNKIMTGQMTNMVSVSYLFSSYLNTTQISILTPCCSLDFLYILLEHTLLIHCP